MQYDLPGIFYDAWVVVAMNFSKMQRCGVLACDWLCQKGSGRLLGVEKDASRPVAFTVRAGKRALSQ